MAKKQLASNILAYLTDRASKGLGPVGADDITTKMGEKRPTVNRYLATLVSDGAILREGSGPATSYRIAASTTHSVALTETVQITDKSSATISLPWSAKALELRAQLEAPIGTRTPVSYQRQFVDGYVPNQSSLLPAHLAES